MQTAKNDQTGRMPRLISVFTGCTCHFVWLVMWWLISIFILGCEFQGSYEATQIHEGTCGYRGLQKSSDLHTERVGFIMPPTSKKLTGLIGFGLSVRLLIKNRAC